MDYPDSVLPCARSEEAGSATDADKVQHLPEGHKQKMENANSDRRSLILSLAVGRDIWEV